MKDSKKTSTPSEGSSRPAIIAVAVLVTVGFVVLFSTGLLKPGKGVASTNNSGLCANIISDYNSAFTQTTAEAHASKLANSAKAAAAIEDNQTDPNCVFIQFTNAAYLKNVDDTAKFANILNSLASDGKYITGQLANPLGVEAIKQNAAAIVTPNDINSSSSIQGNG